MRTNKNPSLDALVRICETHSVNLNWLLTGEGSMFFNNERARVKESDWLELPVVADIQKNNEYLHIQTYGEDEDEGDEYEDDEEDGEDEADEDDQDTDADPQPGNAQKANSDS